MGEGAQAEGGGCFLVGEGSQAVADWGPADWEAAGLGVGTLVEEAGDLGVAAPQTPTHRPLPLNSCLQEIGADCCVTAGGFTPCPIKGIALHPSFGNDAVSGQGRHGTVSVTHAHRTPVSQHAVPRA